MSQLTGPVVRLDHELPSYRRLLPTPDAGDAPPCLLGRLAGEPGERARRQDPAGSAWQPGRAAGLAVRSERPQPGRE